MGESDRETLLSAVVAIGSEHIAAAYRAAAAPEPDVEAELAKRLAQRAEWVRQVATRLGPYLVREVTTEEAAAALSFPAMPETYRDMVVTRGWTPDAFEEWLRKSLTRLPSLTSRPALTA